MLSKKGVSPGGMMRYFFARIALRGGKMIAVANENNMEKTLQLLIKSDIIE